MKIGFTGTQIGMTKKQKEIVLEILKSYLPDSVHHGDCIGADKDFHNISEKLNLKIFVHPPNINKKRAFCKGYQIYNPKSYLERNQDIINSIDLLIATPKTFKDGIRSGTWYTIRLAYKKKIKIIIIWPNGEWN